MFVVILFTGYGVISERKKKKKKKKFIYATLNIQ